MQHLTHINNISVLFVVDPFESANNMFVDEIENEYLLVLNLNELHFLNSTKMVFSIGELPGSSRIQQIRLDLEDLSRFPKLSNYPYILLLFVIFKAQCLSVYAEI